jgi:queuine/archaeosine tRNA-ribosyltransferase
MPETECYLRLTVRLTSKIKNGRMIFSIDEMAITYVDTEYTKAYLRHLFAANEYLGNKLLPSIILGFICGWFVKKTYLSRRFQNLERNDGA